MNMQPQDRGSQQWKSLKKLCQHPREEELVLLHWVNPPHQVERAILPYPFCLVHVGDIAAGVWEGRGERRIELKSESHSFPKDRQLPSTAFSLEYREKSYLWIGSV